MPVNPIKARPEIAVPRPNFEPRKRDLNEAVARQSKQIQQNRDQERIRKVESEQVQRRESIRTTEIETRKVQQTEEQTKQIRQEAVNRQNQERRNPNAGNIVNVVV